MDDMKRIARDLQKNPAALKAIMQSPDGQALMHLLTQKDQGAGLQQAVQSAMRGDTTQMTRMVQEIMQSPAGAGLVDRINQSIKK